MPERAVGRLLVASLHQGIADLLPGRLEFYESWLNPAGLRRGAIGVAPLAAALSFLRQEGEPYHLIAARAGEYTAEWTVAGLPAIQRTLIRAVPPRIRVRLIMRVGRRMVRQTCSSSRARVRWRRGTANVDLRGSVFCDVRDPAVRPRCDFYTAAFGRLMSLFNVGVEVRPDQCRATGGRKCLLSMHVNPEGYAG